MRQIGLNKRVSNIDKITRIDHFFTSNATTIVVYPPLKVMTGGKMRRFKVQQLLGMELGSVCADLLDISE